MNTGLAIMYSDGKVLFAIYSADTRDIRDGQRKASKIIPEYNNADRGNFQRYFTFNNYI